MRVTDHLSIVDTAHVRRLARHLDINGWSVLSHESLVARIKKHLRATKTWKDRGMY